MVATDRTLLPRWPEHLVARIASRNFVLVVGAGISRTCVSPTGQSPPSWQVLLEDLAAKFTSGKQKKSVLDLVKGGQYLEAAELLRLRVRGQSKEEDFLQRIADTTDGGQKAGEQYQSSSLHDVLLRRTGSRCYYQLRSRH